MAITLPAAYHYAWPNTVGVDSIPNGASPTGVELQNLLIISRGLSFILLACYAMFLTFQLYSELCFFDLPCGIADTSAHAYLFKVPRNRPLHPLPGPVPDNHRVFPKPHWVSTLGSSSDTSSTTSSRDTSGHPFRRFRRFSGRERSEAPDNDTDLERGLSAGVMTMDPPVLPTALTTGSEEKPPLKTRFKLPKVPAVRVPREPGAPAPLTTAAVQRLQEEDVDPHRQLPTIKFWYAVGLLVFMTALAGVTAEFLVSSIDGMTAASNVSREFIGLILLPVIGNSVEHITAVTVSVKDKLNLSMSIAVGSSIQVSLGILPILVLIGWAIGQPLTLFFDAFET
jgi:Ca2+:H+ antiporter